MSKMEEKGAFFGVESCYGGGETDERERESKQMTSE